MHLGNWVGVFFLSVVIKYLAGTMVRQLKKKEKPTSFNDAREIEVRPLVHQNKKSTGMVVKITLTGIFFFFEHSAL